MAALTILPDADRVEQALIDAAQAEGFVDATGFVSIAWLVEACEPAAWLRRTPISPLAARLLVGSAARSLGTTAFGDHAKEPAFARAAWDLIQQLKLQDATPDLFGTAIAGLGEPRRPRLDAVLSLWRAYEDALTAQGLADRGDLLRAAADRLSLELPPRLRHFTRVEVHHLHDLPPARARLLQALATTCHAKSIPVKVTLPAANNPQLDVLVNETFAAMERAWQGLNVDAWPEVPSAPLAWVGGVLFGDDVPPQTAPGLTAFSAATPRDEAAQIAHRVRALLDAGTAPEDVAIVFRDLGDDAEGLVEALEDVGVPTRVRLGMPLLATAPGRLALLLPQLVDDGFPVDGVLKVLESRYAPRVSAGAPDAAHWFGLAGLRDDVLGAEGRRGAYEVRLGRLAERLRGDVEPREVRALAERVGVLIRAGRQLPEHGTALQFLDAWRKMLEAVGLGAGLQGAEPQSSPSEAEGPREGSFDGRDAPRLRSGNSSRLSRAVERALARDQAAGQALEGFADQLQRALTISGGTTIARRDFVRLVHDAARDVNLQARGPRAAAVRVLDVRAIAGLHFAHVFVGGLVDGRFPGRPLPLALVTEDERAALNAVHPRLFRLGAGDGELSLPFRQAEDRLLFHLALCAGNAVTLSRARADAGGRELIASPFLDELTRVIPGFTEDAVPRRAVPTLADVRGRADFEARVALEALSPVSSRLSLPSVLGPTLREALAGEPWLQRAAEAAAMESERLVFFTADDRPAGPFSGDLSSPALADARARWFAFGPETGLSVTALGRYGNCAFAGLLAHLLRLEAVEEQGEEPDARTRGTFWHLVFEQLMPALKEKGWLGRPAGELPAGELDAVIDASIDRAARKAESSNAVGHPALWKLGREKALRMVRRVLSSEHEGQPFRAQQWLPESVEVAFGRGAKDPRFARVVVPPAFPGEAEIALNGKIDRIDAGPGGSGVVDYKAGKVAKNARRDFLVSDFQLPAYVLALRQALGVSRQDAAWLFLGDQDTRDLTWVAGKDQSIDELMAVDAPTRDRLAREGKKSFATEVHAVVGQLRAGDVGARPHDCERCSYKRVCRISQRQLSEEF